MSNPTVNSQTQATAGCDFMQVLVNMQSGVQQAPPVSSPYYMGGIESVSCFDNATVATTGVSAYFCGTGALGSGTIWCGYWTCE